MPLIIERSVAREAPGVRITLGGVHYHFGVGETIRSAAWGATPRPSFVSSAAAAPMPIASCSMEQTPLISSFSASAPCLLVCYRNALA